MSSNPKPKLRIKENPDGFVIHRPGSTGPGNRMKISPEEVLWLAQQTTTLARTARTILSGGNEGIRPVIVTVVADFYVVPDALLQGIHLGLQMPDGSEAVYELTEDMAQALVEMLPPRIAKLKAKPGRPQ